jgi:hypothetical protein
MARPAAAARFVAPQHNGGCRRSRGTAATAWRRRTAAAGLAPRDCRHEPGAAAGPPRQWLRGDVAALDELMAESFHFVAMNGPVETKAEVVGSDGAAPAPRPLRIERLEVEPDNLLLDDGTAAVLSLLHIDASVAGRRLPERMRILSVFVRDGADGPWRLFARSITPILAPPAPPAPPAP